MKSILTATAATLLLILSSGCMRFDGNQEELKSELERCLNDVLVNVNDSNLQNIVVNSIEGTSEYDVTADMPTYESPGTVKVDVHVEKSDPSDWFVGYVAIIAVITGPLIPILMVWIICYFIFRSKRDRNRVIAMAIERNYPLPDEYVMPRQTTKFRLQSAINYLAWGIGLLVFFQAVDSKEVSALMLIPIIIGIGKLLGYIVYETPLLKKRNPNDNQEDTRNTDAY